MTEQLLILGASTRAAAHSAVRAGLRPVCGDLFADADLHSAANVFPVEDYPYALRGVAERAPAGPWMYTGALENHPQLIDDICRKRELWGCAAAAVRIARDPWQVQSMLREAGLPCLEVQSRNSTPPRDGTWLLKPQSGAAGRGIVEWNLAAANSVTLTEPHYFQRFRRGQSVSGVYLSSKESVQLLGVTQQLVGLNELHAPPFAWCGTIAPLDLPKLHIDTIRFVGEVIGTNCELHGLFGCDFIVDDEDAWLTEVNPRYTGATEIIEHLMRVPLLDWHRRACVGWAVPTVLIRNGGHSPPYVGKAILYAACDCVAGDMTRFICDPATFRVPFVADIPMPGQKIPRGWPVCTVFASATDAETCLQKLLRRAKRIEERYLV